MYLHDVETLDQLHKYYEENRLNYASIRDRYLHLKEKVGILYNPDEGKNWIEDLDHVEDFVIQGYWRAYANREELCPCCGQNKSELVKERLKKEHYKK